MNTEDWPRAKAIFSQAMSLPLVERETFLLSSCKDNRELHAEVASLLESHDRAAQFLESPPVLLAVELNGRTLGPYRIDGRIGSGGMCDVYAGHDTRLGRSVAIKVLPPDWIEDAGSRARLEREARAVASLNHPHICTIHDIGNSDGIDYLVLELLEGETLAARLERGPLSTFRALEIAGQIASALDAVHRAGIVHRDLKPGNVMLTKGGVKLLDFGISKLPTADLKRIDLQETTSAATAAGFGTMQYMAPELFSGKPADIRTDVFAFGAVVYEMLTGRVAFRGANAREVMAAMASPQLELPVNLSPRVARVIQTCLANDPDDRWQSARDLRRELGWLAGDLGQPQATNAPPRSLARDAVTILITAILVSIGAYSMFRSTREQPSAPAAFEVATPPSNDPTAFAISMDGRRLVFVAESGITSKLWLRPLNQWDAQPIAGTEGATYPFWSPDGAQLGFFADGKLRRINLESGEVRSLADAPSGRGGTWNVAGLIVYAPATAGPLMQIPSSGGAAQAATRLDTGQNSHRWPQFLPDGRSFIYLSTQTQTGKPAVYAGSLDSSQTTLVVEGDTPAAFVSPDRLLYVQRGALISAQFNPRTAKISGTPQPIVDNVGFDPNLSRAAFSVSDSGVLVHRAVIARSRQFAWVDRAGNILEVLGSPDASALASPELSADGRLLVFSRIDGGNADIWTMTLPNQVPARVTFEEAVDVFPIWASDSARLFFMSALTGNYNLYERRLTQSVATPLFPDTELRAPTSASTDGRLVLFSVQQPKTGVDILSLRLDGSRVVTPVVQTQFDEMAAQLSPDGQWVAYQSNSSGRLEIYLRAMSGEGLAQQVSTSGGSQPRWAPNGAEIYYVAPDGRLMSIGIATNPTRLTAEARLPVALFDAHLASGANIPPAVGTRAQYAVAKDGRFLVNRALDSPMPPIRVSLDWRSGLQQ